MGKTKRFLDPIILVRDEARYLTPNGNHRLTALGELGAKAVVGLLVPERVVAYQILALNIEKAHNLRERALEVVRMYRDLAGWSAQCETDYELEFEDPALVTLGFAYAARLRRAARGHGRPGALARSGEDPPRGPGSLRRGARRRLDARRDGSGRIATMQIEG